jgi:hypothetical protein
VVRDGRPPAWTTLLVVLGTIGIVGGLLFAFGDRTQVSNPLADAAGTGTPTAEPPEPTASPAPSPSGESPAAPGDGAPTPTPSPTVSPEIELVDVLNQTDQAGLAGRAATVVADAGWPVRTIDNAAFGAPSTTLYVPEGLQGAGDDFADAFSIPRTRPAFEGLPVDALTLVLAEPDALDVVVEMESLPAATGG